MLGHDLPWWLDTMNTAYVWALIIGALAAFAIAVTSLLIIRWQAEIQREKDADFERYKIAVASEVATANATGETAKANAAKANERAAEANARAAEATLALEKFKAPRTLNPNQATRIVAKLKPFSGTQFDIALQSADPEAESLMGVIELVLISAAWSQVNWEGGDLVFSRTGKPILGIVSLVGVAIQMHQEQKSRLTEAAIALRSALTAEGIEARVERLGPINKNLNALHVLIGKKQH